jgi:hypothetical protein
MRLKRKSAYFSLMELCVCLAILMPIAGMMGFFIKKQWNIWHFQQSTQALCKEFRKIQTLAMAYQTDFTIKITKDKTGKWLLLADVDEPHCLLKKGPLLSCSGIEKITWKTQPFDHMRWHFLATGDIDPQGTLKLIQEPFQKEIILNHSLKINMVTTNYESES